MESEKQGFRIFPMQYMKSVLEVVYHLFSAELSDLLIMRAGRLDGIRRPRLSTVCQGYDSGQSWPYLTSALMSCAVVASTVNTDYPDLQYPWVSGTAACCSKYDV
jgi:hypothetical protein